MSAILFLMRKEFKNYFRNMVRHPSKLIANLIVVALIVFSLLSFSFTGRASSRPQMHFDLGVLHGIFLGWLLLLGVPTLLSSMENGASFFRMPDVNFLFVSPVSPKTILSYGLVKKMLTSLMGFIFMIFYSGMLTQNFDISMTGVLFLILGSAFFLFLIQTLSLLLYSFTNGRPLRKKIVKAFVFVLMGIFAAETYLVFLQCGGTTQAIGAALASPYLEYFPLVGWTKGAVFALIAGSAAKAAAYGGLLFAATLAFIVVFRRYNVDYYEDVLQNAERVTELTQAIREKRAYTVRRKKPAKLGRTGIGKGWGASTFFYKQLCEARRRSRLVFLSTSTFMLLGLNLGYYLLFTTIGKSQNDPAPADMPILFGFFTSIYILFLMDMLTGWRAELTKPYIFLAPESAFKKLLWSCMMGILKPSVDGVIIFGVTCAVSRANPGTGLICILGYASFAFLFTAGNVMGQRIFGSMANRGLIMFLHMIMILLLLAPGAIAAGVLIYVDMQVPFLADSMLPLAAGIPVVLSNILVSLVVFYACRNVLSNLEMN